MLEKELSQGDWPMGIETLVTVMAELHAFESNQTGITSAFNALTKLTSSLKSNSTQIMSL